MTRGAPYATEWGGGAARGRCLPLSEGGLEGLGSAPPELVFLGVMLEGSARCSGSPALSPAGQVQSRPQRQGSFRCLCTKVSSEGHLDRSLELTGQLAWFYSGQDHCEHGLGVPCEASSSPASLQGPDPGLGPPAAS